MSSTLVEARRYVCVGSMVSRFPICIYVCIILIAKGLMYIKVIMFQVKNGFPMNRSVRLMNECRMSMMNSRMSGARWLSPGTRHGP